MGNQIDAVFIIGTKSFDNNKELRYALRSLDKYCKFVRNVYICGFCPAWIDSTNVICLRWPDRFIHAKDANIIDKLRHACECPGISKNILFCSDDQFLTKKCDFNDFTPRYLRMFFKDDQWYNNRGSVWHKRLRNTLLREVERRENLGIDKSNVFYYQPHIWMPIDRDKFIEYAKWSEYEVRTDTIIASGYYNFVNANGVENFDHKFLVHGKNTDISNITHVAYHDTSFSDAMNILKKLFPNPCKFEKEIDCLPDNRDNCLNILTKEKIAKNYDPSPATNEEIIEICKTIVNVRTKAELRNLIQETTQAEELRFYGVPGWRTVWNDIVVSVNQRSGFKSGSATKMSDEALSIVNRYKKNPTFVRTVSF